MTTPDSDTPTVLFSNTSKQWRHAIHATVAVSRLRRAPIQPKSPHQGLEAPQQEPDVQEYESINQNGDVEVSYNEEANWEANQEIDPDTVDKRKEDPEVEVLKQIRDDLIKQLDAYGIVLVLLAGITFLAILQPPGSFDTNGKLQSSVLVAFFMLLATLSFFITCTGILAVMIGCAQLFRPFFYPRLTRYTDQDTDVSTGTSQRLLSGRLPAETLSPNCAGSSLGKGCPGTWHGLWKFSQGHLAYDSIDDLAKLCIDNVYRVRRIRVYLGLALVLCIAAYICGALAVMVTNVLQRYMLVGAMGAGGLILFYEICKTVSAAMKAKTKIINPKLHQELRHYTMQRMESTQ